MITRTVTRQFFIPLAKSELLGEDPWLSTLATSVLHIRPFPAGSRWGQIVMTFQNGLFLTGGGLREKDEVEAISKSMVGIGKGGRNLGGGLSMLVGLPRMLRCSGYLDVVPMPTTHRPNKFSLVQPASADSEVFLGPAPGRLVRRIEPTR